METWHRQELVHLREGKPSVASSESDQMTGQATPPPKATERVSLDGFRNQGNDHSGSPTSRTPAFWAMSRDVAPRAQSPAVSTLDESAACSSMGKKSAIGLADLLPVLC